MRHVVMCPAWDPVCEINRSFCAPNGGSADTELEALHYSYLNWDYESEVLDKWRNSALLDTKKLGYRFHSSMVSIKIGPDRVIRLRRNQLAQ